MQKPLYNYSYKPFSNLSVTVQTIRSYNSDMARPSKLDERLIEDMAREIEDGLPIQYACDLFGITRMSYLNWMQRGEEDYNNENETIYSTFFAAIKKAYATFVKESKQTIRSGRQGWQGAAWWLERTNKDFMPKQQIQADDEGKVQVVIGGKVKEVKNSGN